jgi:hypothetical protein
MWYEVPDGNENPKNSIFDRKKLGSNLDAQENQDAVDKTFFNLFFNVV